MTYSITIAKVLSPNDVGATGAHQAGILVNKRPDILSFFPRLNEVVKNPRRTITVRDSAGIQWKFEFIYYNNKFFGGTRNEYRLTCMTPFFKAHNARPGDAVLLTKAANGEVDISLQRPKSTAANIKLGGKWVVIPMSKR